MGAMGAITAAIRETFAKSLIQQERIWQHMERGLVILQNSVVHNALPCQCCSTMHGQFSVQDSEATGRFGGGAGEAVPCMRKLPR